MFEAVIFDFDGVILDSEPIHYEACCYVLKDTGLVITYQEYVEKYLGLCDKEMFPSLLKQKGYNFSPDEINSMINKKIESYIHIINNHTNLPFIPYVDQYIAHAANNDIKIALCTGSTRREVSAVLSRLKHGKLQSYFRTIVTSEDVQYGKPSPEGFLLTANRLGVLPAKCLVIEDSPHGIEAAKRAGMYVIGLLTTHNKSELQNANRTAEGFEELLTKGKRIASQI